jgi:hypothetical protein
MVNGLATAIIIVGLAVGAYGGLMALLDRAPRLPELVGLAALEVVLLAQTVIALSKTFTGERPDQLATFVGYLLTTVLLPPLGALFGWAERSRWGSVMIAGSALVVTVLVVRLQQVWHG